LWFNAVAAQPIVNQSQAQSLIGQLNSDYGPPGLQVPVDQTLALVGGDVLLEGGRLTAAGGRIELGSVTGVGQVSLSQSGNGFVLGYDSINDFGPIALSNGAFVDVSGKGGGEIQILGGRLEMTQSSKIWADTLGAENGKEVLVRATEVVLSESSSLSASVADTGTGGNLRIDTGRLLVRSGSQVQASTFGEGKGGSLLVTASESVELIGTSPDGRFGSGLFTQSGRSGDAGDLTIDTPRLLVRDGAVVAAGTFGDGDSGNLNINTGRLLVLDGGQIVALTQGVASGGNLNINASESVEVMGTTIDGLPSQIIAASGSISRSDLGQLEIEIAGPGGNLTIYTGELTVKDSAQVSVNSNTSGDAGNLVVEAGSIFLNNEGKLTANSDAAQGVTLFYR
jgi:large exoprotein involved in heme utilization and adhesion